MSKECRSTNDKAFPSVFIVARIFSGRRSLGLRALSFVLLSSFGFRHSTFQVTEVGVEPTDNSPVSQTGRSSSLRTRSFWSAATCRRFLFRTVRQATNSTVTDSPVG